MSKESWKQQLDLILEKVAARNQKSKPTDPSPLRVAVVGVGNELNGDDAAGRMVAAQLGNRPSLPAHFVAIDAGSLPESASAPLHRFCPDVVIFVDAADFGGEVGEILLLEPERIGGLSASSHTLPLPVFGGFIEQEYHCQVAYLGIQPQCLDFDTLITATLQESVGKIVAYFNQKF